MSTISATSFRSLFSIASPLPSTFSKFFLPSPLLLPKFRPCPNSLTSSSSSPSRTMVACSNSSEEAEVSQTLDEWLQKLPDKTKPLYSHSLPCIEAWLRSLGFYQSRDDRALWFVENPDWQARLSLDITELHIRVADKDWGADFRKLSAGAALVGLTLWLDHMQDASLQGFPESPKSIVLITGKSEYNRVSLNSTVKAYLWEMGSPFLPCKTRTGIVVAKAHSLRMWLKDSPFCLDLELKNRPSLPEMNSMLLMEGCFIRRGLVPAFKEINERLGPVNPRKFARLAMLSNEKREKVIQADIDGRREKLAKLKSTAVTKRKNTKNFRMNKFVRVSGPAK